ncbi:MGH1-like glycoside hydrolase domain-containing protein [Devosia submarina]|uniref:MGH1-like glycoside hydrolase domain-containing protein n=1 Tax=Devosia submarina TaxID=1173082 RepID=UPI000D3AADDE|nr:hypothetical protein [Devosia submarina]
MSDLLERLRGIDIRNELGSNPLQQAWAQSGVRFVARSERYTSRYYQAVRELFDCIKPAVDNTPILHEGGVYHGCWLESTGTINTELLSRFLPDIATATYEAFATHQRADGLIPYKLTLQGPGFSQIQLVTPLARCIWNHYRLNNPGREWLGQMYRAMSRYDDWLASYRNTLGTGAVEAFCTYDTGHDLSPRFWHVPDTPLGNDAATADPSNPILPFVAPDLTANVVCQRRYLALIARELGAEQNWSDRAGQTEQALYQQCFHPEDGFFYDRDRHGQVVRLQSDVLLRVLACEIGDAEFFAASLRRYLLNTRKFFPKYPFTSIALDDPRFDPAFDHNSWGGPSNFLSIIRAPHAFEHHGHHAELTWVMQPILAALADMETFPQTLNPFTGKAGFTEKYSPSILCYLDFVERLSGIMPRSDGTLWFTGLIPKSVIHRQEEHQTAYGRTVDGTGFELVNTPTHCTVYRDGNQLYRFPAGLRLVTDRRGQLRAILSLSARPQSGQIETNSKIIEFTIEPNQELVFEDGCWQVRRSPGIVYPCYE